MAPLDLQGAVPCPACDSFGCGGWCSQPMVSHGARWGVVGAESDSGDALARGEGVGAAEGPPRGVCPESHGLSYTVETPPRLELAG